MLLIALLITCSKSTTLCPIYASPTLAAGFSLSMTYNVTITMVNVVDMGIDSTGSIYLVVLDSTS